MNRCTNRQMTAGCVSPVTQHRILFYFSRHHINELLSTLHIIHSNCPNLSETHRHSSFSQLARTDNHLSFWSLMINLSTKSCASLWIHLDVIQTGPARQISVFWLKHWSQKVGEIFADRLINQSIDRVTSAGTEQDSSGLVRPVGQWACDCIFWPFVWFKCQTVSRRWGWLETELQITITFTVDLTRWCSQIFLFLSPAHWCYDILPLCV